MAKIKAPKYFKWRDGRPRWEPGPGLRTKGWKGQNLKDDAGAYLGLEAAIAAAEALNNLVDAGTPVRPMVRWKREPRTVARLIDDYLSSSKFRRKAPSTQADYRNKANIIRAWGGDSPVRAIDAPTLHAFYEHLFNARGHHMANAVLAVTRLILSHGKRIGWVDGNPAKGMELESVPARVVIFTAQEILHVVDVAEALGEYGVADAFVLALHSGQRQGDVLTLPPFIFTQKRIALSQSKTGAQIDIKPTPQLAARIAAMQKRRRENHWDNVPTMIVDDHTGMSFKRHTFGHRFAMVRQVATTGDAERGLKAMPSVETKKFMDTRDTAVTRFAMAGRTLYQIAAITGHKYESIQRILRHYLALNRDMADAAIDGLVDWMEKEGIEL